MDDLFAPPTEQWRRISPRYTRLKMLDALITFVVLVGVASVVLALTTQLWWLIGLIVAAGIVVLAIRCWIIPRQQRAWGFALREDDLYITHGVMFRELTAVPYGRMQLVEVNSGPLERLFGVATVKLVTASPGSNATIEGLPPQEAAELRDQLTSLGETKASGL